MGLFDKLFGRKTKESEAESVAPEYEAAQLQKTAEMLDEDLYWSIIEKSLKGTSNQDEQERFLIEEI